MSEPTGIGSLKLTDITLTYSELVALLLKHYRNRPITELHMKGCIVVDIPPALTIFGKEPITFLNFPVTYSTFYGCSFSYSHKKGPSNPQ